MDYQLLRRHGAKCPDRHKGDSFLKCKGKCRFYVYVFRGKKKHRVSLLTRDYEVAKEKFNEYTRRDVPPTPEPARKYLSEAIVAFLQHKGDRSTETLRKYRRHLQKRTDPPEGNSPGADKSLESYCLAHGLKFLPEITLEHLDGYVQTHRRNTIAWAKHIEHLRAFWAFSVARKWCEENIAMGIELPDVEDGDEVVPYSREEVARMIAACDLVGKRNYERLRCRAMVLLMRFTGIRISDVVTLSREHIQGGYLVKRAIKNNARLRIKLEPIVLQSLEVLPRPEAAAMDSLMYFAGQGAMQSLRKGAERVLARVFELAGVKDAYPHRFRHTFASELLAKGTDIEVVADLLGDSVTIVRKHYWKWVEEWQQKKDEATGLLSEGPKATGAKLAHERPLIQ